MMNKEAKQERSQIPPDPSRSQEKNVLSFTCSPGVLEEAQWKVQVGWWPLWGSQPDLWHSGDYGLRVHGYPE